MSKAGGGGQLQYLGHTAQGGSDQVPGVGWRGVGADVSSPR